MNQKKNHPDKGNSAVRLLAYWRQHKLAFAAIVALALVSVGCSLLGPYILGGAIDQCIDSVTGGKVDFSGLTKLLLSFTIVALLSSGCTALLEYAAKRTTLKITGKLRNELMQKLQHLPLRYHDNHQRGQMLSHFTNDVELIRDAMGFSVIQLTTSMLSLVGALCIMGRINLTLTAITCATIPLTILLSRYIIRHTRKYFSQQRASLSSLNAIVEEDLSALKSIQAFDQEQNRLQRFDTTNMDVLEKGKKAQIYSGILMPLLRVLDNLSYLAVTVAGSFLAVKGVITVGTIQTFLLYSKNFQRPVNSIATQINSIQAALAGAERIFALLDEEEEAEVPLQRGNNAHEQSIRIDFENVHFSYHKGKEVLSGVSFTVKPNETVAIVGTTGAGKSTLIHLLSRFHDVDEGSIKINGQDIRNIPRPELRKMIGIVLQDPFLFSETIRYNIGYGKEHTADKEIEQAAQAANIEDYILSQPQQYGQTIAQQGCNISHGQRQLLTIARAIAINAPLLILDEATSNIDTRTELLFQKTLSQLSHEKTCLIIAHRLNTVRTADKIVVLDKGIIAESGKHEELLAKGGVYYQIYCNQLRGSEV